MPQFIVHFGVHKTGTSAFQAWLLTNRTRLFDAGLIVPGLGASPAGNYKPLVEALVGQSRQAPERSEKMLSSLAREMKAAPNHDVIISSEYLSREIFREHLQSFSEKLDSCGYRKMAIVIVRDQGNWMNSGYAQRRKMLIEVPPSFESFVADRISDDYGNWLGFSETLVGLGFEFATLPYAQDFRDAGAVRKIMSLPGLTGRVTVSNDEAAIRQNDSLGAIGLIVADQVRERALETLPNLRQPVRVKLSTLIQSRVDQRVNDTKFNALTPKISRMIAEAFDDANACYAKRYFDQPWSELFPPTDVPRALSPRWIEDLDRRDAEIVTRIADKVIDRANELNLLG